MLSSPMLQAGCLNLKIGLFYPSMNSDLWEDNMNNLALNKQDMQAAYYGIEYEHFINRNVSFTLEGGYYEKEHYTFYRDYEYEDGSNINQNISLEMASLEANFKIYPIGYQQRFYPYLGAGGGIYYWKYKQWGDFIDFTNDTVSENEYAESSVYSPGFNVKGGMVMRFSRGLGVFVEGRYQYVKGNLSSAFEGFEKFDLSGFSLSVGMSLFL